MPKNMLRPLPTLKDNEIRVKMPSWMKRRFRAAAATIGKPTSEWLRDLGMSDCRRKGIA